MKNIFGIHKGLNYFEDAEQEMLPKTFVNYNWEEIKQSFIKFQEDFQRGIEKLEEKGRK